MLSNTSYTCFKLGDPSLFSGVSTAITIILDGLIASFGLDKKRILERDSVNNSCMLGSSIVATPCFNNATFSLSTS